MNLKVSNVNFGKKYSTRQVIGLVSQRNLSKNNFADNINIIKELSSHKYDLPANNESTWIYGFEAVSSALCKKYPLLGNVHYAIETLAKISGKRGDAFYKKADDFLKKAEVVLGKEIEVDFEDIDQALSKVYPTK